MEQVSPDKRGIIHDGSPCLAHRPEPQEGLNRQARQDFKKDFFHQLLSSPWCTLPRRTHLQNLHSRHAAKEKDW
jgi:hypothetical protein